MKIIIVTPDEPFYLSENINYLISKLQNNNNDISTCVLLSPSPYGRRESFFSKSNKIFNIFGFYFFSYYSLMFLKVKLFKPSVKKVLKFNKIPITILKKSINHAESLAKIKKHNPDLIISILSNEIFKSDILNMPSFGCINLHTSLLPNYKGVMPSFWVLKNNEKYTGVSVFKMDEGIDSGPIICQKKVFIDKKTTQQDLIIKTKRIGMDLIIHSVEKIKSGKIDFIPNSKFKGDYFSFPKKIDVNQFLKQGGKFF